MDYEQVVVLIRLVFCVNASKYQVKLDDIKWGKIHHPELDGKLGLNLNYV